MAVVCYSGGAQLLKWRSTIGKELPRHRISTAISAAYRSKPKTTQLTSSSLESFEVNCSAAFDPGSNVLGHHEN